MGLLRCSVSWHDHVCIWCSFSLEQGCPSELRSNFEAEEEAQASRLFENLFSASVEIDVETALAEACWSVERKRAKVAQRLRRARIKVNNAIGLAFKASVRSAAVKTTKRVSVETGHVRQPSVVESSQRATRCSFLCKRRNSQQVDSSDRSALAIVCVASICGLGESVLVFHTGASRHTSTALQGFASKQPDLSSRKQCAKNIVGSQGRTRWHAA